MSDFATVDDVRAVLARLRHEAILATGHEPELPAVLYLSREEHDAIRRHRSVTAPGAMVPGEALWGVPYLVVADDDERLLAQRRACLLRGPLD